MTASASILRGSGREVSSIAGPTRPASPHPADWDAFVLQAPGGDLVQSSLWAAAKRPLGFEAHQLTVRNDDDAVAGAALLLLRRLGPLGAVGYIARGPLLAPGAEAAVGRVLDEIERAARRLSVRHLVIQPPAGCETMAEALAARGYTVGALEVAPSATLLIDLEPGTDALLAAMSSSARRSVRQAQRRGVWLRHGDAEDLELFHRLHAATASRRGFAPVSMAYLRHHWDALRPRGAAELILACHEGRAFAAVLLTAFGDTVTARLSGWTGEWAHLHGSAACEWEAIRWAKEAGYRRYDVGGIDQAFAQLLLGGAPVPEAMLRSPAAFKAAFGGRPVLLPGAWQRTLTPVLRPAARAVIAGIGRSDRLRACIERLRKG